MAPKLHTPPSRVLTEPWWVRSLLIFAALAIMTLMLLLPLFIVFAEGLRKGWEVYLSALTHPDAMSALKLTLLVAGVAVPINAIIGVAVSWCVTRFDFPGKGILMTLIDLPFAVSPVVAGLIYVLVFGQNGWVGPWLIDHGFKIIFTPWGVILATIFITFPFVARELIPIMQSQGADAELAALTLGASGWKMFWRVTLPNIKWGLFYGIILCNARAMGEFGAVSVVSGHLRGFTNTLPLHIEILYNEYQFAASFAVASVLALLAIVTLVLKSILEARIGD